MKGEYVITFYTHYNALAGFRAFEKNDLTKNGDLAVKLIPVPREISSSCGTALKLSFNDKTLFPHSLVEELEHEDVFEVTENGKFLPVKAN